MPIESIPNYHYNQQGQAVMSASTMEQLQADKITAEIAKIMAESTKINAESRKISAEAKWYPFVAVAAVFGAAMAALKLLPLIGL